MKKRKRLILVLIAILLCNILMVIYSNERVVKAESKKIIVGTNAEFPPFEYINTDGEVDGFDIALIKEIGKRLGYEIEIRNMEFKSLTASLKTKSIDVCIAGMTVTEDRKKTVDFSDEYYTACQSIITKKNSKITSLNDLNGKKIAVQEGTTGDILVTPSEDNETIVDENTEVKRFKKGSDAILELKNNSVDAVVIDTSAAKNFVSLNSELKLKEDKTSSESYAIAVTKGNKKLKNEINSALIEIKEDGTYDKIVDKYINEKSNIEKSNSDGFISSTLEKINYILFKTNGASLLFKGLFRTIYIAFAAIILGVILGFFIALLKMTEVRKGRKTILSRIANIYISIFRGTPVLVQLLIIYMVIFKSRLGVGASIITFALNSAAYVAENIRAGIMAVDNGQIEAGRSLGFNYPQTMRYIIMPQAIKNCIPALGNEFVSLIKETSIVGYVAIQDLTKAADFIISRTYETFIPLIIIAIIYFLIIILLTKCIERVEIMLRKSDMH